MTFVVIVVAVGVAAALAAVEITRRRLAAADPVEPEVPVDEAVRDAVALAMIEMRAQAASERDAAVHAAIEQAAVLGREQLGAVAQQARQQSVAELGAKKDVIDSRLDQVRTEMRTELEKLGRDGGSARRAERRALRAGRPVAARATPRSPTPCRSRPRRCARRWRRRRRVGQWGERMAEDVLRLAGFVENVNYVKQTQLDGALGSARLHVPAAQGPRALHGRQVPDGRLPALPRRRHRQRAPDASRGVPA